MAGLLEYGGQWLRHWCHAREPRALRTALVCKQIAVENLAVWQAELALGAAPADARCGCEVAPLLKHARGDISLAHAVSDAASGSWMTEALRC
jgi:hypothetical protein